MRSKSVHINKWSSLIFFSENVFETSSKRIGETEKKHYVNYRRNNHSLHIVVFKALHLISASLKVTKDSNSVKPVDSVAFVQKT